MSVPGADPSPGPGPPEPGRILAIQLKRLGDVVLATAALRALRAAWPAAHLAVLTEAPFDQALADIPGLDEILVHPRGLLASLDFGRQLAGRRFDTVFDFYGSATSARLSLHSGARMRVGWARRGRRLAYTHAVATPPAAPPRFTGDQKLDLLRAVGVTAEDSAPLLRAAPLQDPGVLRVLAESGLADGRPFLLVAPASRRAYKRWTGDAWADALSAFQSGTGATVLLAGGPGEESQVEDVRACYRGPVIPQALSLTSINAWRALLPHALLVLGPDGGIRQMAQALGVATVGLFGPQNPAHWISPRPAGLHLGIRGRRPDCALRCSRRDAPCACLAQLPVAVVSDALVRRWNELTVAPLR